MDAVEEDRQLVAALNVACASLQAALKAHAGR